MYGEEEGEENEEDIEIDGEEMADEEGDDVSCSLPYYFSSYFEEDIVSVEF